MGQDLTIGYDEYIIRFKELIKSLGLNSSIQREYVLKVLFNNEDHLNAEQILSKVRDEHKVSIGMTTVYKILTLLEELKVVKSISIEGSDTKVYELDLYAHHDHIVCLKCSKIIEFVNEKIEELQECIAKENNFILQSHSMILYGLCQNCKTK
ncbi:MAG: transcriptional repressor [Sulfurovum sp.]|nr:transcriptional repressor [Sulfurovum sp.]